MREEPRNVQTQECRKKIGCVIIAFFTVGLTIYFCGCEQSQSDLAVFDRSNQTAIQSEAFQIIGQSLSDEDPLIRANSIEVVATIKELNLMPRVQKLLQDEYMPVRFAAALAVGDLKYSPARSDLNRLLKDTDTNVILAASYAMTQLGYPGYIEVLRQELNDNNQTIRANAAMLLGKSGDKNSLELLHKTLIDQNSDDLVAYQTAEAIAMLGDESIYPKLWTMLISAFADVRVIGIRAMGTLGTKQAESALLSMLDDQVLEVRIVAAEQLGMLNNRIGEATILEVFDKRLTSAMDIQSAERVNVLAALAIGRIGTSKLANFLPQLMKNESKYVRLAAAQAFFQITLK